MEKLGPGTYEVRVTDSAPCEAQVTGNVGICHRFECAEGFMYFNNWAGDYPRFIKDCATLGVSRDQLEAIKNAKDVDRIDDLFRGAAAQIVVENNGDKYGAQVKWVNEPGGKGGRKPVSETTKAKLAAIFSGNTVTGDITSAPRSYVDPAMQGDAPPFNPDDLTPF